MPPRHSAEQPEPESRPPPPLSTADLALPASLSGGMGELSFNRDELAGLLGAARPPRASDFAFDASDPLPASTSPELLLVPGDAQAAGQLRLHLLQQHEPSFRLYNDSGATSASGQTPHESQAGAVGEGANRRRTRESLTLPIVEGSGEESLQAAAPAREECPTTP